LAPGVTIKLIADDSESIAFFYYISRVKDFYK
jgi:hypothetical protein